MRLTRIHSGAWLRTPLRAMGSTTIFVQAWATRPRQILVKLGWFTTAFSLPDVKLWIPRMYKNSTAFFLATILNWLCIYHRFGLGTAESSRQPDDSCSPSNDESSSLFVRAIDRSLSDEQIRKLFSQYGVVQSCEITRSATGYVKMGSPEQAKAARAGLDSDADLYRERRLRVMQRPKSCLSTLQRTRSSRKTVRFVTEILSQGGGDMETRSISQSGGGNHEGDSHSRNDGDGGGHPHSVTTRYESFFGGGRLGRHHQKRNPMTNSGNRKVIGRAEAKNILDDRNRGSTTTTDTGDVGSPFAKKTDHHRPSSRRRPKKPKQSPPASPPPSSGL